MKPKQRKQAGKRPAKGGSPPPSKAKPKNSPRAAAKAKATTNPRTPARPGAAASPGGRPARPAKKRAPSAQKVTSAMVGIIDVQWPGVRNTPDGVLKRFYRMDSLIHGVENMLGRSDAWLLEAIRPVLGTDDVVALGFRFVREDKRSLYFRLDAATRAGKKGRFALVVSRNHEEHAKALERRLQNLELAALKAPALSVKLLGTGPIFLPDRPGRRKEMRPLLAAVTALPLGLPCTWKSNGQIVLAGDTPVTLSLAGTDAIRCQVAELVLRCYDPVKQSGIAPPRLDTGDLLVYRPPRGAVRVAYAGGDALGGRPRPVHLLARLYEERGGGIWLPQDPEGMFQAVSKAVGRERAVLWLGDFVRQAANHSVTSPGAAYVDALRSYVVE